MCRCHTVCGAAAVRTLLLLSADGAADGTTGAVLYALSLRFYFHCCVAAGAAAAVLCFKV